MKVLIVSHNCFSETQNMGKTLMTLFSQFDKSEIMQLFFHPSVPMVDICSDYYRITDKDVIKSLIKRKSCGATIFPSLGHESIVFDAGVARKKVKQSNYFLRRLRDVLWQLSKWKSDDLKLWLNSGKPDVVFYALGESMFSQNIAMWISDYLSIPLVTYICDDFYFYGKKAGLLQKVINAGMIKNLAKTIKKSKKIISICEEMGEAYEKEFSVPFYTAMTGSSFEAGTLEKREKTNQLSYIGNLSQGRWESLLDIKDVLDEINKEYKCDYKLVYYGKEKEELAKIIQYGGLLDSEGVKKTMAESLMLIHTEGFNEKFQARVKFSVSTKIADSLASGTCLLAYGPNCLASIGYLKNTGGALVVTDKSELKERLHEAFADPAYRSLIEKKALAVATQNHESESNSHKLHHVLENI